MVCCRSRCDGHAFCRSLSAVGRMGGIGRRKSEETEVSLILGYLATEGGRDNQRRVPVGDRIVLGRAVDCGLVIEDASASRHHLEIYRQEDGYCFRDLGSTNGTFLNGAPALEGKLSHGDILQIGEATVVFESQETTGGAGDLEQSTLWKHTILDVAGHARPAGKEDKSYELLRAVYSVINQISSNFDLCSLSDRILETLIKAVDAELGAILWAAADGENMAPCPVCSRVHMICDGRLEKGDLSASRMSRTVAHRVLRGGESVLYQDVKDDDEINLAESVQALELRSIICVPLRGKYGISGILYMHSTRDKNSYTEEDLLLCTAVGNSAGLALENAQMHQEILEKQRMDQEIEYAWSIQEGFLVKDWPTEDVRFQVYGETRPAKTVGGDFYDFVRPDADHVGVLIGDVSGKGVPAALTMARLLTEFRILARDALSPAEVFKTLNPGLYARSRRGMFCTLCYLTIDLRTGRVCCANAGHYPVLHVSGNEIKECGFASGPPAGVVPETPWVDTCSLMEPGDTILLYTDGIVEAKGRVTSVFSEPPNEYGVESLMICAQANAGADPGALVQAINEDVCRYSAPSAPHDDCTLIALRYAGAAH